MFQYKHGEVKPIVIKAMVKSKARSKKKKKGIHDELFSFFDTFSSWSMLTRHYVL